jgi:kinesin family protein 1
VGFANFLGSLTALGQVISTLVQKQNDPVKNKSMVIPYRNSTLTKLLVYLLLIKSPQANSLGGNSKTIMIGAISPAHDAYEDTLSTLRFLDRAKGIKNVAVVNENPVDKMIRELKEENEALKKKLLSDGGGGDDSDTDEIKRQIAEQEIAMRELNKTWAQKLEEAMMQQSLMDSDSKELKMVKEKMKTHPHLINLNEDPLLTGLITLFIENGEHALGRSADSANDDIPLSGLNILPIHGYFTRNEKSKQLLLRPANGGQIRVNGRIIEENPEADGKEDVNGVVLSHNDRVMIGLHQLFLVKFSDGKDGKESTKITSYRNAQREIAAAEGYGVGDSGLSSALIETISEVLAAVQEANAIAEELMVPKRYVLVINKQDEADSDIRGLVSIKVKDFERHNKWIMSSSQFLEAHMDMKDMYCQYVEGGGLRALSDWPEDKNPFFLSAQDWLIGSGKATFKNLTSVMKIKETILLQNGKGANEGILTFSVHLKVEGLTDVIVSMDALNELDEKLRVEIVTESVTGLFLDFLTLKDCGGQRDRCTANL